MDITLPLFNKGQAGKSTTIWHGETHSRCIFHSWTFGSLYIHFSRMHFFSVSIMCFPVFVGPTDQDGDGIVREGNIGQSDARSTRWGLATFRAA